MAEFDGYQFLVTEENDVMLIIYARSGDPENPTIEYDKANRTALLHRNQTDDIVLENLTDTVLENLSEEPILLVTEVLPTENPLEHQVKQIYKARVIR